MQRLLELGKGVARWQEPRCLSSAVRYSNGRIRPIARASKRQLAYPGNAETRMMIQRIVLEEYEQIFGSDARSASERLRALDHLKTDGLINEEEYNTKRKEILGEL